MPTIEEILQQIRSGGAPQPPLSPDFNPGKPGMGLTFSPIGTSPEDESARAKAVAAIAPVGAQTLRLPPPSIGGILPKPTPLLRETGLKSSMGPLPGLISPGLGAPSSSFELPKPRDLTPPPPVSRPKPPVPAEPRFTPPPVPEPGPEPSPVGPGLPPVLGPKPPAPVLEPGPSLPPSWTPPPPPGLPGIGGDIERGRRDSGGGRQAGDVSGVNIQVEDRSKSAPASVTDEPAATSAEAPPAPFDVMAAVNAALDAARERAAKERERERDRGGRGEYGGGGGGGLDLSQNLDRGLR